MKPRAMTMVEFYLSQAFNPVFIPVEEATVWENHVQKRKNLYERHLGIPLSLLAGRSILEFGCNSGENGLVLAASGARLTFVEPNHQVLPRLKGLFSSKGLEDHIVAIHPFDIQTFQSEESYDVVIAEGFLSTLGDRDQMLGKIAGLLKPFGFGVISYNDRCGGLLEMLKRAILHRLYRLLGVEDVMSERALQVAQDLLLEDFHLLNASRSFETWWRDTMVVPVYTDRHLWSFPDILPVLEASGCLPYGTSPVWSTWEHFNWYKNVPAPGEITARYLHEWEMRLPYFVTGREPQLGRCRPLPVEDALTNAMELVGLLSGLAEGHTEPGILAHRANPILDLFRNLGDDYFSLLADEMASIMQSMAGTDAGALAALYRASPTLRNAWGTPYHYLCFRSHPRLDCQ